MANQTLFIIHKHRHGFFVKAIYANHLSVLYNFAKTVTIYSRNPGIKHGGGSPKTYAVNLEGQNQIGFLASCFDRFMTYIKNIGYREDNYTIVDYEYGDYAPMHLEFSDTIALREGEQTAAVDFFFDQSPYLTVLPLPTGRGKTITAKFCADRLGSRFSVVTADKHIDNWYNSLIENTKIDKSRIIICNSKNVQWWRLMDMIDSGSDDFDILLISNSTLDNYIKAFTSGDPAAIYKYRFPPDQFYTKARIALEITDEGHEMLHQVVKRMISMPVRHRLVTTASTKTKKSDDNRIIDLVYPVECRFKDFKENDHVVIHYLLYNFLGLEQYMYKTSFGYNHNRLEKNIIKLGMAKDYLNLIHDFSVIKHFDRIIESKFDVNRLLLFFSSVDMCQRAVDLFAEKHPQLIVRKKTAEDSNDVLRTADIIISTPLSCGTGRDIPNLVTVINTVAMDTIVGFEQNVGRLRNLEAKSGIEALYCQTVCHDIGEQIGYMRSNSLLMQKKTRKIIKLETGRTLIHEHS